MGEVAGLLEVRVCRDWGTNMNILVSASHVPTRGLVAVNQGGVKTSADSLFLAGNKYRKLQHDQGLAGKLKSCDAQS